MIWNTHKERRNAHYIFVGNHGGYAPFVTQYSVKVWQQFCAGYWPSFNLRIPEQVEIVPNTIIQLAQYVKRQGRHRNNSTHAQCFYPRSAQGFACSCNEPLRSPTCLLFHEKAWIRFGPDWKPTLSAICVLIFILKQSCLKSINSRTYQQIAQVFYAYDDRQFL